MTLQWGMNQQINKVTSNCGRFYKGNNQRPLTERKGEGSALERASRESTIRGRDSSRDEQCQCPDEKFCFLKKKKSIANDIRLPFVCFGGKYTGIYYLLHLLFCIKNVFCMKSSN